MTILKEEIHSRRPPAEVFHYVANFANCEQWDPGVISADKTSTGPLGLGTTFKIACKLPVGKLWLDYEIVAWEPPHRVQLVGRCPFFTVTDTITMAAKDGGTHLVYTAEFDYRKPVGYFAAGMQKPLQEMGERAVAGLAAALDQEPAVPEISRASLLADRLVLPGVALFSRAGYSRGKKHWAPDSACIVGQHIVITGATSGIGLAAAQALAARGARLTLVVRDAAKGEKTRRAIVATTGNEDISLELAELSLIADVRALVNRLLERDEPIDVLVNNAGALINPREITAEGLEKSFALLLLGPYILTEGLHPLLARSGHGRVVNVVSGGMYTQKLELDKLNDKQGQYSGSVAYARAKRGLTIMTEEWARRWRKDRIVVNAMHPGWADTPGVEQSLPEFYKLTRRILRTPEQGADTIVWLAASQAAGKATGQLFLDREPHPTHLLQRTRETPSERKALVEFLRRMAAEHTVPTATRGRTRKAASA